jgi:hypothetical protein
MNALPSSSRRQCVFTSNCKTNMGVQDDTCMSGLLNVPLGNVQIQPLEYHWLAAFYDEHSYYSLKKRARA